MASLNCHTASVDGVTLVELLVTADTPTRVRVENRLDGPVWPPRRQGVPAAGWSDEGFEGVVADRLVLGYASPADPVDPPAALVETAPVEGDSGGTDGPPTPRELVRRLGRATPPRAAVAPADPSPSEPTLDTDRQPGPPPALEAWFETVEAAIVDAERLAEVDSIPDATAAVADAGGLEAVADLRESLVADRHALRRTAARCVTLADRAQEAEIPVETLARLV